MFSARKAGAGIASALILAAAGLTAGPGIVASASAQAPADDTTSAEFAPTLEPSVVAPEDTEAPATANPEDEASGAVTDDDVAKSVAPRVGRQEAIDRAKSWLNKGIKYNQSGRYQGWRTDCSGYVSFTWKLNKPGPATSQMPRLGRYLDKSQLLKADALLAPSNHVVLFDKWADSGKNSYWGFELSPSKPNVKYRKIPYPYFKGYGNFKPFRINGIG